MSIDGPGRAATAGRRARGPVPSGRLRLETLAEEQRRVHGGPAEGCILSGGLCFETSEPQAPRHVLHAADFPEEREFCRKRSFLCASPTTLQKPDSCCPCGSLGDIKARISGLRSGQTAGERSALVLRCHQQSTCLSGPFVHTPSRPDYHKPTIFFVCEEKTTPITVASKLLLFPVFIRE